MARSKIIINGETYIDLTNDDVLQSDVARGKYFHLANGNRVQGTNDYDVDSSEDTAVDAEVLSGKTYSARGTNHTGTMTNNGAVAGTISTKAGTYTVPQGFHDGSGTVGISSTEQAKIIAGNIKSGVEILGVTGEYAGEAVSAQSKAVTASFSQQTVLPDTGYDYLSQVTVNAVPVTETVNPSGGTTITVG